ncbi:helix-turn-helix transcriptional regulator [Paenibacillus sp. GCM10023248]|uniref:helix-turn-helix transcriptional regulator n=1 Tax=Bacillales TaxID=1385 RepID=UPI002378F026|nr:MULTISPECIES: AraC family transcriptional regulator [Bacillales]MDD9271292.1 AraC family transcriptional regulator [Paenibacillus sp. MAHUQ-63]MDR6881585.1 AraC-like DNA-binding protein [Bacillus sp. 3255]
MREISLTAPPLPYYLESGYSVYQAGDTHPDRTGLGMYDLVFITKGTLYLGEEERAWTLTEGHYALLLPDKYHYAVRPCEAECRFYWLHFQTVTPYRFKEDKLPSRNEFALPQTGEITLPQQGEVPDPAGLEQLWSRLQELAVTAKSVSFWEEQVVFADILRMLESGNRPEVRTKVHLLAEQIEAFLKRHYSEDISNESLSRVFHFHPNYLGRCMKQVYGCTPLAYLHAYRIEQSKLLLLKTQGSMERIAEQVGFHHAAYFSNCFRAAMGLSPLAYRKQFTRGGTVPPS